MKLFMVALMGLAALDAHAAESGSATAAAVSAFTFSGIKGSLTAAPNVPAAFSCSLYCSAIWRCSSL